MEPEVSAVVLDIEGTTGSAAHVHEQLFPFARDRFAGWLAAHRGEAQHEELLREIRMHTGKPGMTGSEAAATLAAWSDDDVKAPPLKKIQGLIWAEGYADGSLKGHVYDDVPTAFVRWREQGVELYIYSSGAVQAQHDWFAHTPHGDLSVFLTGYFDLDSAGGKRERSSYEAITRAIRAPASRTLFLSDVREELDAATGAGWQAIGVRRPDDPREADIEGHPTVGTLDEVRRRGC